MVEPIRTPCHQGHQQTTTHKHRCRILVQLQVLTHILQNGEFLAQSLYLRTPLPKPLRHIVVLQVGDRLAYPLHDLLIRLARGLLDGFEHGLTG